MTKEQLTQHKDTFSRLQKILEQGTFPGTLAVDVAVTIDFCKANIESAEKQLLDLVNTDDRSN